MKAFFIGMLALAFAIPSFADTIPAGGQARWNKYFHGSAQVLDPEVNLYQLLADPNDRCVSLQKKIIAQTIEYGRVAFNSSDWRSQYVSYKILSELTDLMRKGDACFDAVTRAYLAATLDILDPANSNVSSALFNIRINGRPIASDLTLVLLGAALLNHHLKNGSPVIQFLTPAKREKLGSLWTRRLDHGKGYLVFGGYDCSNQAILIDPFLPPLNLASILVHEMDHLFRDRVDYAKLDQGIGHPAIVTLYEEMGGKISTSDPGVEANLPLKIAMDETLASVMSAYYQRRMRFFRYPVDHGWGGDREILPFQLSDDLTLFRDSPESPINDLWKQLSEVGYAPGSYEKELIQFKGDADYFLSETFLRGDVLYPPSLLRTAPLSDVEKIYQTIYQGYFGQEKLVTTELNLLDPKLHNLADDPLARWLDAFSTQLSTEMTMLDPPASEYKVPPNDWVKTMPLEGYVSVNGVQLSSVHLAYDLNHFFDGLDLAFNLIFGSDQISPYCADYLQGLQNGGLDSYAGSQLSTYKPGEGGVKPGEGGVKPGEGGVKPGEGGVKPGEGGVKPGEGGVKPALFRPCLNIGDQL